MIARHRLLLLGLLPIPFAAAVAAWPTPLVLVNTSPSEPPGLYRLTGAAPQAGARIAFRIPQRGQSYAARFMPERLRSSVLKTVAATQGDHVCTDGQTLVINGSALAPIAARDRRGMALPQWRDCRHLRAGELFVFSSRIPNSFDSRYYGPVNPGDVIGVYEPLRGPRSASWRSRAG